MYARVARYDVPPERIGDAIEQFRESALKLEELDGLERGYVLVDEEGGSLLTVTVWDSRRSLDASETRAGLLRQAAARAADGSVQSVACYEVVAEMGAAASPEAELEMLSRSRSSSTDSSPPARG